MAELTIVYPDDLDPFELHPGDFLKDLSEYLGTWFGEEALIVHPEVVTDPPPSLGQRLNFQPIESRTHGYNGQEHR